jgi:hypothetical protein
MLAMVGVIVAALLAINGIAWAKLPDNHADIVAGFGSELVVLGGLIVLYYFQRLGGVRSATNQAMSTGDTYAMPNDPNADMKHEADRSKKTGYVKHQQITGVLIALLGMFINGHAALVAWLLSYVENVLRNLL